MSPRDPKVDAYIVRAAPFARPILEYLREIVHQARPDVGEALKWGSPHFSYNGMFCHMAAFKQHAVFGFWKHRLLVAETGPLGKSDEKAMGQFGRLTSVQDLPARRVLLALVRKAAKFNDETRGRPAPARPRRPANVSAPAWFLAALRKNKRALATYERFSPSNKREYVEWVTGAKTAATRETRLATSVEWMSEGKIHNWKYARK